MKFEHTSITNTMQSEDGSRGGGEDDNDSSGQQDNDSSENNSSAVPNPADDGGVPHRRIASLDTGIHSGVPTRTTATLTPTTLRNIEQTYFEFSNELPSSVPCQAGFVAPLPSFQFEPQHQQQQQQQQQQHHIQHQHQQIHEDLAFQPTTTTSVTLLQQQQQQPPHHQLHQLHQLQLPQQHQQLQQQHQQLQQHSLALSQHDGDDSNDSFESESSNSGSWTSQQPILADDPLNGLNTSTTAAPAGRKMGGRRPKKSSNLTPAEEEKRRVRRERNKLAAARCRQRRVTQTNELTIEVNALEKKKQLMQQEMQKLQEESEQLSIYLQEHRGQCRLLAAGGQKMEFKLPLQQQQPQQQPQQVQASFQQQPPLQQHPHLNNNTTASATTIITTTTTTTSSETAPTTINNNNNNNTTGNTGISAVFMHRPMVLPLNKIKVEPHIKVEPLDIGTMDDPLDEQDDDDLPGPPCAKKMMLSHSNPFITAASAATGLDTPTTLNTPNILPPFTMGSIGGGSGGRPSRPSSLAVPVGMTPSQCKSIADMAVSITTPSTGVMFNFDSLMDGRTGLTPVTQPLMPSYPSSSMMMGGRNGGGGGGGLGANNNGAGGDLVTPTSEPSKLVSL